MKVYIYKIENKVNGKIYIGKSSDITARFAAHRRGSEEANPTKVLYKALKKYGLDNFIFEIIETTDSENWIEREIYHINNLKSMVPNGYNMIEGGDQPPTYCGEDHPNSKLTEKDVFEIADLLKNSEVRMVDIAEQYDISRDQITRINNGHAWDYFNFDYPIRRNKTKTDIVDEIKQLLKESSITQRKIGEMFSVGRTTITAINLGKNHFDINETYPLRSGRNYNQK